MRIDKFLKIAMLFKTRSSAEKAIENQQVKLNDKPVKPAASVSIGDQITLFFPLKTVVYQVEELHEKSVAKVIARKMTTLIKEEKHEI
ncbi:MAG: RNA-binding S4 domain-containing protein [Spirochaetes bacterium]|nr:RNA-binding S4 domain-containing protein [Spirochaetota bacterium]